MPPDDPSFSHAPAEAEALRHVERLVERNRRDTGIGYGQAEARPVRSLGIVGAGLMGTAIAAAAVKAGLDVVINDADPAALAATRQRIAAELALQTQDLATDCEETVRRRVEPSAEPAKAAACDLVLESIVESPDMKRKLYARLTPHLGERTVLASNTSTIPVGKLAAGMDAPERFCGFHFFHPVRQRPLVEIVRGPQTSDTTVATAVQCAKQLGKMPIVVADGPAFLVNRLLLPYLIEAVDLLLDGAAIDQVEQAAAQFGMAIGPLRILDEIGLDTVVNAGRVLWQAFPERIVASPLLVSMYKRGRLGRKSGAGFFAYLPQTASEGDHRPDPAALELIAQWARPPQRLTCEAITHRLFLPMVLEATRLLEEQRVRHPGDIDLAVLFGLGFPQRRGGLLYWADTLGAGRILQMLAPLAALGQRLEPTRLLRETAQRRGRLYDWHPGDAPH